MTKPFEFLIANSGSFDFAEKKTGYFNSIGKSLMLKKIILTDSSKKNSKKSYEKLLFVSDPAHFIKSIETLR